MRTFLLATLVAGIAGCSDDGDEELDCVLGAPCDAGIDGGARDGGAGDGGAGDAGSFDGGAADGGAPGACSSDAECSSSRACHHGRCVVRECVDSSGCSDGRVCDMGVCAACSAELTCPDGLACVDGFCAPCAGDAECPPDHVCRPEGCTLVCRTEADCSSGMPVLGCRSRYEPRRCGRITCDGSLTPFPQGEVCDPCLTLEGGCPSGTCNGLRQCTCTSAADCPPSLACVDGVCGRCTDDEECGCDRYCGGGECHDRCASDADCSVGHCNTATGRCVICTDDSHCGEGRRCYEDGCIRPCPEDRCSIFVSCHANGRCGECHECDLGPRSDPIGSCG